MNDIFYKQYYIGIYSCLLCTCFTLAMSGTPSSTEKARNIKRSRTWRDGGKPLKIPKRGTVYRHYAWLLSDIIYIFYIEQIIRIPATSMKPLKDFQEWITQTEFKLEHCIKVSAEILLDDDVNKSWPMKQEYCDR